MNIPKWDLIYQHSLEGLMNKTLLSGTSFINTSKKDFFYIPYRDMVFKHSLMVLMNTHSLIDLFCKHSLIELYDISSLNTP